MIGGTTLDIIKQNCRQYYFHNPAIGNFDIELISEKQYVPYDSLLNVIKAGFSIPNEEKYTKVYNKLVRVVKKIAPYTEVEHVVVNPVYEGEKFKCKEYISSDYSDLVQNKDYKLGH